MRIKTFLISFVLLLLVLDSLLLNFLFAEDFITKGPAAGELYFIAPHPSSLNGLALYHSWDYGLTNITIDSLNEMRWISADSHDGSLYYSFLNVFYYSDNHGSSWTPMSNITGGDISSGRISGEIFDNAVWYSNDYGMNWVQHLGNGLVGDIGDYESSTLGNLAGEVYFLSSKGFLFFSPDTGNNFTLHTNLGLIQGYDHYLRRGSNTGELFLYNSTTQELFFSNDSGHTFTLQHQFVFEPTDIWYSDATGSQQAGELFVLAYRYFPMSFEGEFYIYHSTDYGQTWNYNHHTTNIKEKDNSFLKTYYLSQNYPNPFNGETHIEFYLPFKETIELAIYSITGEKIRTLRKEQTLPGRHSVRWDGTNQQGQAVASGLYFYQLKTPNYQQSKKLLYIR